jgi:hypothetical protein
MAELLIQRRDRAGYWEAYPVYVNREQVARIGFGETIRLQLPAGRYQINCGGLFGKEDGIWIELNEHRKALYLNAELLARKERPWPKYYRLLWQESSPVRLQNQEVQAQLKVEQGNALIRAFGFLALLALSAAWLFWQAQSGADPLLAYLALIPLALIPWVYRGVLITELKKQGI